MTLLDLQNQIKSNNIGNFYIFSGNEIGIMNKYIKVIAEKSNLEINRVDSYKQIEKDLSGSSLFGKNSLYIIYNDKDIGKQEDLIKATLEGKVSKNNKLILRFDNIDKRKKLFIDLSDYIVTFNSLDINILLNYIISYLPTADKYYLLRFIQMVGLDYDRLFNELDKILILKELYNYSDNKIMKIALSCGLIYDSKEELIFDLVKLAMKKEAAAFYNKIANTDSYLLLISLIVNNLFNILSYKAIIKNTDDFKVIQKQSGLNYYQIKDCQEYHNLWQVKKLLRCIEIFRKAEKDIKLGKVEPKIAFEYCLLFLFGD